MATKIEQVLDAVVEKPGKMIDKAVDKFFETTTKN